MMLLGVVSLDRLTLTRSSVTDFALLSSAKNSVKLASALKTKLTKEVFLTKCVPSMLLYLLKVPLAVECQLSIILKFSIFQAHF